MSDTTTPLLSRTTCCHCWNVFAPEEALWVSAHNDLLGDPRLGPEQHQRFLPTRFDVNGNAIDARGMSCTEIACPHCHLKVPRALLEMEPFFVSILGTPACGKSYYLAAMTWMLRRDLPTFGVSLQDADPVANQVLNEYEQSLFLNPRSEELVPLADLIRKTELQGELYDTVLYGNQTVSYPRPFLFTLTLTPQHPNAQAGGRSSRLLCLYDNAGEHYQPGMDSASSPATRHLARSRLLLYLFDPTQDPRFRERCQDRGTDLPGMPKASSRQQLVLAEAASRIRQYTQLAQTAKHPWPLVVAVTKYDSWAHLLGGSLLTWDPWKTTRAGFNALDLEDLSRTSNQVRTLLVSICPEVVDAAEGFAKHVFYCPVSALGRKPLPDPNTGRWGIRPRKIRPIWSTAPMLYGLSRCLSGMIPRWKSQPEGRYIPETRAVHG
jgi:hypothetical protein